MAIIADVGAGRFIQSVAAILLVFAAGCARSEKPPIADSTMVELLIEFHLANARMDISDLEPPHLRDSIFAHYGVDSAAYVRATAYYAEDPKRYGEIYGRVLDRLNLERISVSPTEDFPGPERSAGRALTR